jgi:hypothetical protein
VTVEAHRLFLLARALAPAVVHRTCRRSQCTQWLRGNLILKLPLYFKLWAYLFGFNQPAVMSIFFLTTNESSIFFSHNKPTPATGHQTNSNVGLTF